MGAVNLKVEELQLDTGNPRFGAASGQRDAIQKVIDDQGEKLAALAQSIADDGMNPMDRLLVVKDGEKYTAVEGNRRVVALKILVNPHMLSSMEMKSALRKRLEKAAKDFEVASVEPIAGFEVADKEAAKQWLLLRHTGQNGGRGVVDWSGLATQRFRGDMPALQVLEFVKTYGDLTAEQREAIEAEFRITTLDRLLSSKEVRSRLGFDVKKGKLVSSLPPVELLKPLRRMVVDIATGAINVNDVKKKPDQAKYADDMDASSKPDLTKAQGSAHDLDGIRADDFKKEKKKTKGSKTGKRRSDSERNTLIPRSAHLNITDPKIEKIANELKGIKLDYPNAVAVLFRVFLELSVDHYMDQHGIPDHVVVKGHKHDKNLKTKVEEVVADLVAKGSNKRDFQGVTRAVSVAQSPLSIDLLNAYVHNRFVQPKSHDLASTWDDARAFFEKIWQ